MCPNDRVTFGVEGHCSDGRPVTSTAGPASRVERAGTRVQRVPSGQGRAVFTSMALSRVDISNAMRALVQGVQAPAAWDRYLHTEGDSDDIRLVRSNILIRAPNSALAR